LAVEVDILKIINIILFAGVLGFAATAFLVDPVRRLALLVGAVDQPDNVRKVHARATPALGGLSIVAGVTIALTILVFYPGGWFREQLFGASADARLMVGLILSSLMIVALGVADDIKPVRARWKLIVQIAAALVLCFVGRLWLPRVFFIPLEKPSINLFGMEVGVFSLLVTVLWIIVCTNAVNLIDGIDGLAGGVSFIAGLTILVYATVGATVVGNYAVANYLVPLLMATLCGAIGGFLIYNFPPAIIFLGDSGSLFLGFMIGAISIRGSAKNPAAFAFIAAILPLGLPMMDSIFAAVRRWGMRLPISGADREHIHHRLSDWGLSHKQILVSLYAVCIIFGALSLIISVVRAPQAAVILVVAAAVILAVGWLVWRREATFFGKRIRDLFLLRTRIRDHRKWVVALVKEIGRAAAPQEVIAALGKSAGSAGLLELTIKIDANHSIHRGKEFRFECQELTEAAAADGGPSLCVSQHGMPLLSGGRKCGSMSITLLYDDEALAPIVAGSAQEIAGAIGEALGGTLARHEESPDATDERG